MLPSPVSHLSTGFVVAFDLDGTLVTEGYGEFPVVSLPRLFQCILGLQLRKGTLPLMRALQQRGLQLGIYTLSNRAPWRLRLFFALNGIGIQNIVTHKHHQQAVDEGRFSKTFVKYPPAFGIDLLIDNECVIAQQGEIAGFDVLLVSAHDRRWAERILAHCPQQASLASTVRMV